MLVPHQAIKACLQKVLNSRVELHHKAQFPCNSRKIEILKHVFQNKSSDQVFKISQGPKRQIWSYYRPRWVIWWGLKTDFSHTGLKISIIDFSISKVRNFLDSLLLVYRAFFIFIAVVNLESRSYSVWKIISQNDRMAWLEAPLEIPNLVLCSK